MSESPREPREVWGEVGRRLEELSRAVRGHLAPEPDSAAATPPGAAPWGNAPADPPSATPPGATPPGVPASDPAATPPGPTASGGTEPPAEPADAPADAESAWTAATDDSPPRDPGAAGAGSGAGRDRDDWAAARESVRRLGESAQRLADRAGEAARDPQVRDSAQRAARTLGDALSTSVENATAELRARMRSPRWSDSTRPRPTEPPPVTIVRDDDPTGPTH